MQILLFTETPEWDDPELQAEIKAATGIDLSRKGKRSKSKGKKKCKQKKYPGLTDIRNELNPVRKRLEKKVLNQYVIISFNNSVFNVFRYLPLWRKCFISHHK